MAVKAKTTEQQVDVPPINIERFSVTIIGDSSLIMHKWSEKAKRQMLDKQMKVAKTAKDAKNPEQDYEDSIYRFPDGRFGFPSVAFKNAAVGACRFTDGTKMTVARGAFHIEGELTEIFGEPVPREDMVRIGMGTSDIRYRAEFPEWKAVLVISYNSHALSVAQIVNLINLAGFGVGVGEWRPEKNGQFGRFHVELKEASNDL